MNMILVIKHSSLERMIGCHLPGLSGYRSLIREEINDVKVIIMETMEYNQIKFSHKISVYASRSWIIFEIRDLISFATKRKQPLTQGYLQFVYRLIDEMVK